MKTIAIIGARLNSSRLPKKHLLPLAGKPMIEQLWQRLGSSQEIDYSVLATTSDAYNASLVSWAEAQSVPVFSYGGDVNDLVGRIDAIVKEHAPDFLVYLCGDCPLIEPTFLDRGLQALKNQPTSDSTAFDNTVPLIHEGAAFYSRAGWEKLVSLSTEKDAREHVGYGAKGKESTFSYAHTTDDPVYSTLQHRISIDTQADYRFMKEVYRQWYSKHESTSIVDLKWVIKELQRDPWLGQINAHVIQRQAKTPYETISLYCQAGPEVGLGHLMRMARVAELLNEYLALGVTLTVLGRTVSTNRYLPSVNWITDENALYQRLREDATPVAIIDLHPNHCNLTAISEALGHRKNKHQLTVVMDKLACLAQSADWAYVPSFFSKLSHQTVSFGWNNYLLSPPARHLLDPTKQQITLLTGGSDVHRLGQSLPKLLNSLTLPNWDILWVQGPLATPPALGPNTQIKLVTDPEEGLSTILANSEIVLTLYGNTFFEALQTGAATILLPPADCCAEELATLRGEEVCWIAQSLEEAVEALDRFTRDAELRRIYQKRGLKKLKLADGQVFIKGIKRLLKDPHLKINNTTHQSFDSKTVY